MPSCHGSADPQSGGDGRWCIAYRDCYAIAVGPRRKLPASWQAVVGEYRARKNSDQDQSQRRLGVMNDNGALPSRSVNDVAVDIAFD